LPTAYGDTVNPYASKTANYVLASPNGSAGVPSFRALIAADIPSLSTDKLTSGILIGTYGGTGVNNSTRTITIGGNLTLSGAYNTTLTVTAATSITLPVDGTVLSTTSTIDCGTY